MPVHSCSAIISTWSVILAECIASSRPCQQTAGDMAGSQRITVTLEDSLQAIEDTLGVIYGAASKGWSAVLAHILETDKQHIKDIIIIADKYNMPGLIEELDGFLSAKPSQADEVMVNANEACYWAASIGSIKLRGGKQACGQFLARSYVYDCTNDATARIAQAIPWDVSIEMVDAMLQQIHIHASATSKEQRALAAQTLCRHVLDSA